MCSRFTELFQVDHPLELCQYEASLSSSPVSSTNEDTFLSSSSESSLHYNLTVNSEINLGTSDKAARPQNPHSKSFASFFSNNDDDDKSFSKASTSTPNTTIKKKLKRFLTVKKPNKNV